MCLKVSYLRVREKDRFPCLLSALNPGVNKTAEGFWKPHWHLYVDGSMSNVLPAAWKH